MNEQDYFGQFSGENWESIRNQLMPILASMHKLAWVTQADYEAAHHMADQWLVSALYVLRDNIPELQRPLQDLIHDYEIAPKW